MSETPLVVKLLAPDDYERWDAFVDAAPQATFFHRAGWKQVIEAAFRHRCYYLYAERDGHIEGILPLAHIKSWLFDNALVSTPFCVYGGVAARTQAARELLVRDACDRAELLKVDYLELREREVQHADWPHKDLYYTFRKTISADADENLKAIPRKQRAVVRKAFEAGLSVETDTDVDRLYALYAYSLRNLGTPVFAKQYMRLLQRVFGEACEILTITRDGQAVASVLSFYFRDEVLPYYAGSNDLAREFKANDFMYWELMQRAAHRGVRTFDFGRSKADTGAFQFKRHWGFEPQPLHYAYFLVGTESMPNLSPANPRYERAIKTWQKLPIPVTRVIGPVLARNLG